MKGEAICVAVSSGQVWFFLAGTSTSRRGPRCRCRGRTQAPPLQLRDTIKLGIVCETLLSQARRTANACRMLGADRGPAHKRHFFFFTRFDGPVPAWRRCRTPPAARCHTVYSRECKSTDKCASWRWQGRTAARTAHGQRRRAYGSVKPPAICAHAVDQVPRHPRRHGASTPATERTLQPNSYSSQPSAMPTAPPATTWSLLWYTRYDLAAAKHPQATRR